MKTTKSATVCLNGLLAALILLAPSALHAQAYDIVSLGNFSPKSLNNLGQVVGNLYSLQSNTYQAFEYSNRQTQDLFPNYSGSIFATSINDRGQIAGFTGLDHSPNGPTAQAFVYDTNTGARQNLGLGPASYGLAINQNGDIVGSYRPGFVSNADHAYIYSSSTGQFHDIDPAASHLVADSDSVANAINNLGQAAGTVLNSTTGNVAHVFIYGNGVMHDVGTLPGSVGPSVTGINDSGAVIGYALIRGSGDHGFLYRNGQMQDLSALTPNNRFLFPDGINNAGDIVGQDGDGGFLYHNGAVEDLNSLIDPSLGWNITGAVAINDNGQIIGGGNLGGFIMTPHITAVPAPGSLLTFGLGTGVMLLAARRRKRG